MKYRKKPVVIEAIQYNGLNKEEIDNFAGKQIICQLCNDQVNTEKRNIFINTLEGVMKAAPDDYIIKGVNGEFYPCKPDIFAKTYDIEDEKALDQESKHNIFVETATPLVKFLCENYHPHVTVLVTPNGAELVEGIECFKADKYILD